MNQDLLKLEQDVKEIARETISRGHVFEPIMFITTPNGLSIANFVGIGIDSFAPMVTQILRESKAIGYVLAAIAWRSVSHAVAEKVAKDRIRLTDLPLDDRDETIMIVTVENGTAVRMSTAIIWDLPQGKQVKDFKTLDSECGEGSLEGKRAVLDW